MIRFLIDRYISLFFLLPSLISLPSTKGADSRLIQFNQLWANEWIVKLQAGDCRLCHLGIAKALENQAHFKSYRLLKDEFKGDLSCTGCHLGEEKGKALKNQEARLSVLEMLKSLDQKLKIISIDERIKEKEKEILQKKHKLIQNMLKSAQEKEQEPRDACDSCHGLGRLFVDMRKNLDENTHIHLGLRAIGTKLCQSCHVDQHLLLMPFSDSQAIKLIQHKD
jgi:hypothetical protein